MNHSNTLAAQQFRLREYPSNAVNANTWQLTHDAPAAPAAGQLLVRNQWLSVDPGMCGWITPKRSYMPPVQPGEVMRAFGVAEVVQSNAPGFQTGDVVTGFTGVQTLGLVDAQMVRKIDLRYASAQHYLSGVGMTGYTAYFGLIDPKRAKPWWCLQQRGPSGPSFARLPKSRAARSWALQAAQTRRST